MDTLILFVLIFGLPLIQRWWVAKSELAERGQLKRHHESTIFSRRPRITENAPARPASNGMMLARAFGKTPSMRMNSPPPAFVMEFKGDTAATGYQDFGKLTDEILANKKLIKEAIVLVTSPGGRVAEYGYLYAQMERIRSAGIPLTACVDTYAASGGYLMVLPANRILAAPLSMVGSIGVVTEMLNFNTLLQNLGVKPLTLTAGEHKRTVTLFGEITEEAVEHYKNQLKAIHRLFIQAVTKYRTVDVQRTCNGDHWTAQETVTEGLGLIDGITTSQEYLLSVNKERDLVYLKTREAHPIQKRLNKLFTGLCDHILERLSRSNVQL